MPPMISATFLGAPQDVPQAAWDTYLQALRGQAIVGWEKAAKAYKTAEKLAADYQIPFIGGLISQAENQEFLNANQMVNTLTMFADEALAGVRKVSATDTNDVAVESLPGDVYRVETQGGRPVLVYASSGDPVVASGTVGLVWLLVVAGVAVTFVQYLAFKQLCETLATGAQQRTIQKFVELSKEVGPEKAKELAQAAYGGSAALEKAKGEAAEKAGAAGMEGVLKTALWAGLGIAALYVLLQSLPLLKAAAPRAT